MEFAEKKTAYEKLMGEKHLEKDTELLKQKNPASAFINAPVVNRSQMQSDVLWDLLDHASEEEILKNRGEEVGSRKSEVGSQKTEVKSQKSKVKSEEVKTATETETKPQEPVKKKKKGWFGK